MAEKLFYSMGEVSELFDVNQSLIRHWEKQFDVLRPKRNKKGNRLFSPQDVEYLKQIYHLVKERGMTLDGARKALRRHRADSGVPRDAELMERLQRIRSMLVEVREQLKETPSDEVYSDSEVDREPAAAEIAEIPAAPAVVVEAAAAVAAEPALVDELTPAEAESVWPEEPAVESVWPEEPAAESVSAEESAAEPAPAAEQADGPAEPETPARAETEPTTAAGTVKKPRRKKDDDNHELFAYYEQSLF
ncbi:MAG: MerR family transcriptional regulator [Alistipes sp.]|nr:MerR family transcriptional regulator [Alistipes sp.]